VSCLDAAIRELEGLCTAVEQKLVWVGGQRSELDETIYEWAQGLSGCADLIDAAVGRCGELECIEKATAAVVEFIELQLPQELAWGEIVAVRGAALQLCTDKQNRNYQVETRRTLSEDLGRLLDATRGCKGMQTVSDYAIELAEALCGLTYDDGVPQFVRENWQEWQELVAGRQLPLAGPLPALEPSLASQALRRFLHIGFLKPTASEVPAYQTASPEDLAAECGECPYGLQCMQTQGKSGVALNSECAIARTLAVNNAGLLTQPPDGLIRHYYDAVIGRNEGLITDRLYSQRLRSDPGWRFCVLQRWNSYTPALGTSEGGGYYLYRVPEPSSSAGAPPGQAAIDVGVVIDPGYGFLKNFFSQGFGIKDVTGVVVTHDHPDHLVDFEPLVNLVIESHKNRTGEHGAAEDRRVDALMSSGASERLKPSIESARRMVFRDTFVRAPGKDDFGDPSPFHTADGSDLDGSMRIDAKLAIHKDASELPHRHGHDSIGVSIEVSAGGVTRRIAVPSDTRWSNEVAAQYLSPGSKADIICLHLGGIAKKSRFGVFEYFDEDRTGRQVIHQGWHLFLPGVLWFVEAAAEAVRASKDGESVLVVLSEFGEEMSHGLRVDLANRLNRYIRETAGAKAPPVVVVPGDVGLVIDPIGRHIQCSCCGNYYSWDMPFRCEVFGDCEQIFYVCAECDSLLADDERRGIFRQRQAPLVRPVVS